MQLAGAKFKSMSIAATRSGVYWSLGRQMIRKMVSECLLRRTRLFSRCGIRKERTALLSRPKVIEPPCGFSTLQERSGGAVVGKSFCNAGDAGPPTSPNINQDIKDLNVIGGDRSNTKQLQSLV